MNGVCLLVKMNSKNFWPFGAFRPLTFVLTFNLKLLGLLATLKLRFLGDLHSNREILG